EVLHIGTRTTSCAALSADTPRTSVPSPSPAKYDNPWRAAKKVLKPVDAKLRRSRTGSTGSISLAVPSRVPSCSEQAPKLKAMETVPPVDGEGKKPEHEVTVSQKDVVNRNRRL